MWATAGSTLCDMKSSGCSMMLGVMLSIQTIPSCNHIGHSSGRPVELVPSEAVQEVLHPQSLPDAVCCVSRREIVL